MKLEPDRSLCSFRKLSVRSSGILMRCSSSRSIFPMPRRVLEWVEQAATNRIEIIRTEMSRALYDQKERSDRLISELAVRLERLETGHVARAASERSTPPRHDRAQFFDISDHDIDVSRPADLPPEPGSLFPARSGPAIPRSSVTVTLNLILGPDNSKYTRDPNLKLPSANPSFRVSTTWRSSTCHGRAPRVFVGEVRGAV